MTDQKQRKPRQTQAEFLAAHGLSYDAHVATREHESVDTRHGATTISSLAAKAAGIDAGKMPPSVRLVFRACPDGEGEARDVSDSIEYVDVCLTPGAGARAEIREGPQLPAVVLALSDRVLWNLLRWGVLQTSGHRPTKAGSLEPTPDLERVVMVALAQGEAFVGPQGQIMFFEDCDLSEMFAIAYQQRAADAAAVMAAEYEAAEKKPH